MNQTGIIACMFAIVISTLFGVALGNEARELLVTDGCALQGSFIIDGKVYDCTPRTKQ